MIIGIVFLLIFAIIGVCIIAASVMSDRVLRIQHAKFHERWISDGRPNGWRFRPKDASWFVSDFAGNIASIKWLAETPDWLANEPEGLIALRWMRRLVFTAWGCMFLELFVMSLASYR
jgi:hypothetical protein